MQPERDGESIEILTGFCTGQGELAIRAATAHSVVSYIKAGQNVRNATQQAMSEVNELSSPVPNDMNIVAMDNQGNATGFSNRKDRTYLVMTADMTEPEERPRQTLQTDN